MRDLAARWRDCVLRSVGKRPAIVLVVAMLAIAGMYCSNDLTDDKRPLPAGDGVYRPALARGDGHMHFLITRSLVFDGDFDFDNDLATFGDPWNQPRTITGKKNVMQQIGPSLIWAPVLLVARGVAAVANLFGADIPSHGYTLFHQRILFATSVLFGWLAIGLAIAVALRLGSGRWAATWAGVAVLLGTSLTYYATYMPSYAHAMDAAACAAFLATWAFTFGRRSWRRYLALGALLGIAMLVRVQDVALGVVVALEIGVLAVADLRNGAKRDAVLLIARGGGALAIALLLFTPQLIVWKSHYGAYLTTPQGPGYMRYAHPMVLELLFSPRNGWLSTHPINYLGTCGLIVGAIRGPRIGPRVRVVAGGLLLVIATQVYTNSISYEWWSASSFGQRRMTSMAFPVAVGLGLLLRAAHLWLRDRFSSRVHHALAIGVLGYLVAWNLAWVDRLRNAVPAGRDAVATCCDDVPAPLSWIARPVYAVVGNPFELPASAWFSLRHRVGLQRWDRVVGHYPLVPPFLGFEDGSYRRASATWNLATADGEPYLLGGYGAPERANGRLYRWTTSERSVALLPVLIPEPHRVTVPIAANVAPGETLEVVVECNGDEVARVRVGSAWTTITFDTDGSLGENAIAITAPIQPRVDRAANGPAAPSNNEPVGVAIGPWRIGLR